MNTTETVKYQPYEPSKWETRIDSALRLIAPRLQFQRALARQKEHFFRYLSAQPNTARSNSGPEVTGETIRGAREKLQVMWNAIEAVDNSGLCTALMLKIMTYVCGRLRWQSRCGDKTVANEYEDYMRLKLSRAIDLTGRFSLRQMTMLDIKGMLVKGDIGTNIVREGREIYIQGIEADRIGNPYDYKISNTYVRGLCLDEYGAIHAVKVYKRNRATGVYSYDDTFPMRDERGMPKFLFHVNPISYDDYRGVSVFKTAIDNATYIDRMREFELQALLWAASQSGVYHTKSGMLPDELPFDSPLVDKSGNTLNTFQVRPNMVTGIGVGEDVTMFQHDRPSPNVIGMVRETIRDICVGAGFSFEFGWDKSGLNGPAVRQVSSEDARAIETWQLLLTEQKLDPVATLVLGNGIAQGEIPFHPLWNRWQWFFPSKGTIDVGRESEANIQEIDAGVNTGALVCAEDGQDVGEILEQRGREIDANIQEAMKIATARSADGDKINWREVYAIMFPKRGKSGGGGAGMIDYAKHAMGNMDGQGVTSDGVELDEEDGPSTNGHRPRFRQTLRINTDGSIEFYRPDQSRDKGGKFEDEGKGADDPGYVHPGEEGKKKDGEGAGEEEGIVHKAQREEDTRAIAEGYLDNLPQASNPKPGAGIEAFSPNTGEMTFEEARTAMGGYGQVHARVITEDVDRQLGLSSTAHNGIGSWSDGAENSVVNHVRGLENFDELRYSAAIKGKMLNQKAMLAFQVGGGEAKDSMYTTVVNSTDLDQIEKDLNKAGIAHRTLLPAGKTTAIMALDKDTKLEKNISNFADQYDSIISKQTGTGEFVGESDTREGAQVNYGKVIQEYEIKYPDNRHYSETQGRGADHIGRKVSERVKPPANEADLPRYVSEVKASPEYRQVESDLDGLAKETKSGDVKDWSKEKNSVGGEYTPERKAFHEKTVNKFLNPKSLPKPGERPRMTLLIGAPGSGKTSAGSKYVKGEYTSINPDALMAELPERELWNAAGLHNESKDMNHQLTERALAGGYSVLVDTTGRDSTASLKYAEKAGKAGYDIDVIHVQIPLEESARRSWTRFEQGGPDGRFVPLDYTVSHVDHLPKQTYAVLKESKYVKNWVSLDNDVPFGSPAKVKDQGHR